MAIDWSRTEAPSLDDIETIARGAFASLPAEFRGLCGEVPFVVQDFPDDDVITELDLETEFDILGLFQGADLAARESSNGHPEPTLIFLYRRPILDYWAEHQISLGEIVRHVLIHEIGHHFGLSDDDMMAIEES
ncbi:metallopeptidase family protein [Rhizomicrobium electricum]|jgi:predicted Zn-dependent protease with MMP-like domain|uniref:Metallopeptidase family protein n=1 Tax=Rhizomicrobium electricum TaxID=480070 RepID=A0ABP3P2H0_9PROT|nr:metallopeptidase family protein [Rhizomicrobium electricum]NIJ47630.1 putative Zn-dependent protease with MMP-like domain [Rhizomicrobium electricum]